MKRILSIFSLLLTLFGVSSQVFASTNVGATLSEDTQWNQSGSPYIIQSCVLVPPGVTLKIGPGVQVVFQGPATLQISGDLKVEGSAAAPAVINMMDGGLQSSLLIDGGEAQLSDMKVLGGLFLAQDATIRMDSSEVTRGSGLYLKGSTVAHLKNNKFYGSATGVVLDGPIEADLQFNTLVQNTYGLYLKDFQKLNFVNNSIHDNESEVVNNSSKAKLGGNYWGTLSPTMVKDKIKGTVSISPMKDLKDVLRAYLRSELPVITQGMSDQAEAEDIAADRAAREALKAFRKKQSQADVLALEAKMKTATPTFTPIITGPIPTPTLANDLSTSVIPAVGSVSTAPPPIGNQPAGIVPPPAAAEMPPAVTGLSEPPSLPGAPATGDQTINVPPAVTSGNSTTGLPAPPSAAPSVVSSPAMNMSTVETPGISAENGMPAAAEPASIPEPPALGDQNMTPTPNTSIAIPPPTSPGVVSGQPSMPNQATNINPEESASTASTIAILPTSQPVVIDTPTPGLGNGTISSSDLAGIVATAQAAPATPTAFPNLFAAPAAAPAASSAAEPPIAPPVAPSAEEPPIAPPAVVPAAPSAEEPPVAPPDVTSMGAPSNSVPTVVDTSIPTMNFTSTFTDTPTNTTVDTATSTFTSTPAVVISTPIPAAPNSEPSNVSPISTPMSSGSSSPALSLVPTVSAPGDNTSVSPPSNNSIPAIPKDAVPPPPDFDENSTVNGVQPPAVVPNENVAPPQSAAPAAQSTSTDMDADGMQVPPMDSGLDFSGPKK